MQITIQSIHFENTALIVTSDASWSSTIHLKRRFRKKVSIDLDWIRSIFIEIRHEEYTFENDQKPVYDLVHGEGIIMQDT